MCRARRGPATLPPPRFPMLLFWTLSTLMVLAALLLVVPVLVRGGGRREAVPGDARDANVALYRERLVDLDRERERGEVDAREYAVLREDLERGLLADAGAGEAAPAGARAPSYGMAVAVAVAVPACSIALYLWLGTPHGLDSRAPPREAAAGAELAPEVETMVASLAARLANAPDDAEGWLLLARSQVVLERFDEALASFERAHSLVGDEPALLADWAEAEAAVAGNRFPTSAQTRLDRALELDPDHEKALWLGGFAAVQSGRAEVAVARWERLLARQEPGSREESIVSELLARVRGAGDAVPAAGSGPAESGGPASPSDAGSADGPRIVVEVGLDPHLAVELGAREPVFVFASTPAGAGPPVAVARTVVGALPATIVLDESSAMLPSRSLASAEQVLISARVARSGTVTRTAGDIEGTFGPVAVADTPRAKIVISRIVP